MLKSMLFRILAICPLVVFLAGCEQLPGERKTQGAVIGGAAGAATGAAISKENRLLGALIGGALGAGGGYIIAAQTGKIESNDTPSAATAARKATENPATVADAQKGMTADLNLDGFVTLDEVVAMKQAGFSDQKMIERLRATDQVFELTADQQQYLRDRGVSQNVIGQMQSINREARERLLNERGDVISTPATTPAPAVPGR